MTESPRVIVGCKACGRAIRTTADFVDHFESRGGEIVCAPCVEWAQSIQPKAA